MSAFVLVLIGPADGTAPVGEAADQAAREVGGAAPLWLAPGEACELTFEARDLEEARSIRDRVAVRLEGLPLDVCTLPAAGRRKSLLIADMDSTIIQQECIDEMADMLGLKPRIAAITERAMRGELPFEAALRERLGLLAGLEVSALQQVFDERIVLMPGARTLVATMRANGAFTALVSGGFSF
ncbi:MAG: HAD-IB family phosphatase, partial [Hyphomicrobium sp.]|nr:HAD-IB family phosphatase [Hyphomicrobium sp.]